PRLTAEVDTLKSDAETAAFLRDAGTYLGIALAPIVRTLDLTDVVLSGPPDLLGGDFLDGARATLLERTMTDDSADLSLRMTTLGRNNVLFGAVVLVLTGQLGVS